MARVVRFHETGGPEVLKIEQLDVPPPGKGEVQISVKALGLNRAESMSRDAVAARIHHPLLEQPSWAAEESSIEETGRESRGHHPEQQRHRPSHRPALCRQGRSSLHHRPPPGGTR
jgi:hypothetical protein